MACPSCNKVTTGEIPVIRDGDCVHAQCDCGTILMYFSNDDKGFFSKSGFTRVTRIESEGKE